MTTHDIQCASLMASYKPCDCGAEQAEEAHTPEEEIWANLREPIARGFASVTSIEWNLDERWKRCLPETDALIKILKPFFTETLAERDRLKGHYENLKIRYDNCCEERNDLTKRNADLVEALSHIRNVVSPHLIGQAECDLLDAALSGEPDK